MAWGRTKDKHYIQRTNYQIIAKIASYEDEKGLVEINIVSWFQKLPVIDIRSRRPFACAFPGGNRNRLSTAQRQNQGAKTTNR